jgi:hypothetical protein
MFSEIDKTIFPDSCEVLEIVPSQHYVFPIFKCGKSSLYESIPSTDWSILHNEEISKITTGITVFLREPKNRFISGVNTYLQQTIKEYPTLDENTILWFVDNYMFLNRHYCPQFFWLLNLARYSNPNVLIRLEHYCDISKLTNHWSDAGITRPTTEFLKKIEQFNWKQLELYLYLDQILFDRIGQELTLKDLMHILKNQYPELHKLVFGKTIDLVNYVLPST